MAVTAEDIIYAIQESIEHNKDEITPSARKLLEAFAIALQNDKNINTLSNETLSLDKQAVINVIETSHGSISNDLLRQWVKQCNQYFENNRQATSLASRKNAYFLTFNHAFVKQNARLIQRSLLIAKQTKPEDYERPTAIALTEYLVFISHKWHSASIHNTFNAFAQQMALALKNLKSPWKDKFKLNLFYDCSEENGFAVHTSRQAQQNALCEEAAIGLVLWSDPYDNSAACQQELNYFIDEQGENCSPKQSIVILEHGRMSDIPHRYMARNLALANDGQSLVGFWEKAGEASKHDFIAGLRDKICSAVDDYIQALDEAKPANNRKNKSHKPNVAEHVQSANAYAISDRHSKYFDPATLQQPAAYAQQSQSDKNRIDIIDGLTNWCNSNHPTSPRVTALLGDFGFGKTITCRLLTHTLGENYKNSPTTNPLPIYLDLKDLLANLEHHLTSPIEHLLNTMLSNTGQQDVGGQQLIDFIRTSSCLVIFDGFDEIGQKLSIEKQQRIYHKLLNIIPDNVYRDDIERLKQCKTQPEKDISASTFPSKILVSCRTHFFNRIEIEKDFLEGSHRHAIGDKAITVSNIQRFYMAPFTAKSIKQFLLRSLGMQQGQRAITLINEVHDLSELSSHPIMLDLICRHLPKLITLQEAGKVVNAATLYLQIFDNIGQRDIEKHLIRLSDKQELLAALALHLWQQQQTTISVKKLEKWFIDYGNQHPAIKNQFQGGIESIELMFQDLCNASLLVRDEHNYYRFSHTSYLEFFRALGIFNVIAAANTTANFDNIFSCPVGNQKPAELNVETKQFLLDWREGCEPEDRQDFDRNFISLMQNEAAISNKKIGFELWLMGQNQTGSFPHCNNPNWSNLSFVEEFIPDNLSHLDLSRANLDSCKFHLVKLSYLNLYQAKFDNAQFTQCYIHHCRLAQSNWDNTQISNTGWVGEKPVARKNNNLSTDIGERWGAFEGHQDDVSSVAFSPDGRQIISGSYDRTLKCWDSESGQCLHTFEGHQDIVNSVAFSADGRQIVSGSSDRTLKCWDSESGQCLHTFEGHQGAVTSVAFSPDGRQIVSGSDDGTVKVRAVDKNKVIISIWHLGKGYIVSTEDENGSLVPTKLEGNAWRFQHCINEKGLQLPASAHPDWQKLYQV